MKVINNNDSFVVEGYQNEYHMMKDVLVKRLLQSPLFNRGKWQSEDVSKLSTHDTHEVSNVLFSYRMPPTVDTLKPAVPADDWAEIHFQERVSGVPLNPAPSYVDWPYHSKAEAQRHVDNGVFSHTYPERMWPQYAGDAGKNIHTPNRGIRFEYGDFNDVIMQLKSDPFTRQAYLPIWFPEDTGAVEGQRVPCTLGYHFIRNRQNLDINYFIRSCDIYRHFTNDVYMTVRLAQYVRDVLNNEMGFPLMGTMNMFISNLHMFRADVWRFS